VEVFESLNSSNPGRQQIDQLKAALSQFSAVADQEWLHAIDALAGEGNAAMREVSNG
jgi:hypothetical protein